MGTAPRIEIQNYRPEDKRGINVFESPKDESMAYEGFKLQFGAAFTQRLEWGGAQTDNSILDLIVVGGGGSANTPDWPTALGPATNVDVGSAATDAGYAILFITGAGSAATISDIYLSDAGTLNVTAADGVTVGKSFAGNASGLTMDRFLLDGSGNITGPANDGCTSAISTTTFAANTTQGLAPDDSVMNSPSVAHTRQSVAEYLTHRYR